MGLIREALQAVGEKDSRTLWWADSYGSDLDQWWTEQPSGCKAAELLVSLGMSYSRVAAILQSNAPYPHKLELEATRYAGKSQSPQCIRIHAKMLCIQLGGEFDDADRALASVFASEFSWEEVKDLLLRRLNDTRSVAR